MKSIRATLATCAVFALLAPAIVWAEIEGTKAEDIRGLEICIVANSYTETDFRDAYERRVRAKGYTTRSVAEKEARWSTSYSLDGQGLDGQG